MKISTYGRVSSILGALVVVTVTVTLIVTRQPHENTPLPDNETVRETSAQPEQLETSITVRQRLAEITKACRIYAAMHRDGYPVDLATLYPKYIDDPATFHNPGDGDAEPVTIDNSVPDRPNSARISFAYHRIGDRAKRDIPYVVMQDNRLSNNPRPGLHIALLNGPVEFFVPTHGLRGAEAFRARLERLGQVLRDYAADHNSRYPERLSELFPDYVSDPAVFWNPGDNLPGSPSCPETIDNDISNQPNSARISLAYFVPGQTVTDDGDVVVLQDNTPVNNHGAGLHVLTADGTVHFLAPEPREYAEDGQRLASARMNLQNLARALLVYSMSHQKFVPALSQLYRTHIYEPSVFWNPGDSDPCPTNIDNDLPDAQQSACVSFAYFGADQQPNRRHGGLLPVMLQDNRLSNNGGRSLLVATDDGNAYVLRRCDVVLPEIEAMQDRLRATYRALRAYAEDNGRRLPEQLSDLNPNELPDVSVPEAARSGGAAQPVRTPFANRDHRRAHGGSAGEDAPAPASGAFVGLHYLGANRTLDTDGDVIVLADNALGKYRCPGLNVLTADGQVCFFSPEPFSAELPEARQARARFNLGQIGRALASYYRDNKDTYPTALSVLYRTELYDPGAFWNPKDSDPCPNLIDNDEPNALNSAQISYAYLAGSRELPPKSMALLAVDNSLAGSHAEMLNLVCHGDRRARDLAPCDRTLPVIETSKRNLRQLNRALRAYAADNRGRFPAKLSMLYPDYVGSPNVFWNPGNPLKSAPPCPQGITSDELGVPNSAQISYAYLGAGLRSDCHPKNVLLIDNDMLNTGGAGVTLLTADGQAEFYGPVPHSLPDGAPKSLQLARQMANRSVAASNLGRIGMGLLAYSSANRHSCPGALSQLYPEVIHDPLVFWHPNDVDPFPLTIDNDVLNGANSAQISFEYLAAGATCEFDRAVMFARDNSPADNGDDGVNILFSDGHTEFVPVGEIRQPVRRHGVFGIKE